MSRQQLFAGVLLVLLSAGSAAAQAPRLVVKGFISSTAYAQNAAFGFGNGQNALWVKGAGPKEDTWTLGTDIRNSRIAFEMDGGELSPGVRAGATVEVDFFGGFNGASAWSDEQPLPRLRLAYVDLKRGATTLRVGQAWAPILGNIPVSTSRMAFPLGLGSAGLIGWRSPGLYVLHTFAPAGMPKIGVNVGAFRGSWSGPGDTNDQLSAGEASGLPQLEGKVELIGKKAQVYAAAHWDRKDVNGLGADTGAVKQITGSAVAAGAKLTVGAVTVHGNAYRGRAIGQQMGQLAQFGDIGSVGGWLQASYKLSPRWSASVFGGVEDPDDADLRRDVRGESRLRNQLSAVMLQYTLGDYSAGIEWVGARTDWGRPTDDVVTERSAHQLAFSVLYRFNTTPPVLQ